LLAGDLNADLKAYDYDTFQVTQSFRYPAPITALGMSSDSRTLAVGMANGTLSVKQLKPPPSARAVARGQARHQPRLTDFGTKVLRRAATQDVWGAPRPGGKSFRDARPGDSGATLAEQLHQLQRMVKLPQQHGDLTSMANHVLDINAHRLGAEEELHSQMRQLRQQVQAEVCTQLRLRQLQSMLLQIVSV